MKINYYHIIALFLVLNSCSHKRPIGRNYNNDTIYFKSTADFEIDKYKHEPYHVIIHLGGNEILRFYADSVIWSDKNKKLRVLQLDNSIKVYGDSVRVYRLVKNKWIADEEAK